jgi:hypothetical protein
MGDAFPKLEPTHIDRHAARMEREKALLSPVFEEQQSLPAIPSLVVHVEIRFTDPVIRSRYCRSYGSSPEFEATNRICRGLVRRIERCSEELLTRKDSGALEMFKGDTYDRKPLRFEMTFRIMRRGKGEWAERLYRSYQKQPLTVALTKEVILATHRMIGLFLRRHDEKFQWLDCPVPDGESEGSETFVPFRGCRLSLLSIPNSHFIEAAQTFEFVPGYSIEFYFRSSNPRRKVTSFERRMKVDSTQTAPLTLFMSENLLWKAEQALNQGLDSRRREFEDQLRCSKTVDSHYSDECALQVDLRICNNLGPVYNHVRRSISSKLALFQDREARDCDDFLCGIERALSHMRNEADAALYTMNDLEIGIAELKGMSWTLREPAKFVLGPETSHDRRTVRAALERVQTGIGDIIRGHNIAIHIKARKRGHLVLDKAIVAHEKRGRPTETFTSREEEQTTLVARLKARIQQDINKVFEDSCSIDDISGDDEDYFGLPATPTSHKLALPEEACSPSSVRSSPPPKQSRTPFMQVSPRLRPQRVFSLSRRSTESVRSIDFLKPAFESFPYDSSRPSSVASSRASEHHGGRDIHQNREPLLAAADIRPAQRSFSLVPGKPPSFFRASNSSTLVEEQAADCDDGSQSDQRASPEHSADVLQAPVEESTREAMTSDKEELGPPLDPTGTVLAAVASDPAVQQPVSLPENDESKDAPLVVSQVRHSSMDTPNAFVDAREYVVTPLAQETRACERVGMLEDEVRRGKDDDAFSTAPSTPELSIGGSSPRHSLLITPVQPRVDLEVKEPIVQEGYPELELGDVGVHLNGHAAANQPPKEDTNWLATDDSTLRENNPQGDSIPLQVTEVPSQLIPAHGIHTDEADGQSSAESTAPEARRVLLDAVMPGSFPPTPTPTKEEFTTSSEFNFVYESAPESQASTGTLGAEFNEGSDSSTQTSDFPTPEVRRSDTDLELDHAAVLHDSTLSSAMSSPNDVLESSPEAEPSAIETAGSELGAGCGAEAKAAEDIVDRCVQDDASGAPPGDSDEVDGAEPEAVPSEPEVPDESPQGTEQVTENIPQDEGRECTDTEWIFPRYDGPDAGISLHDGGKTVDDGPGLVAEKENEPSDTVDIPCEVDVGSTKVCEHAPGDDASTAQLLEIAGNGAEEIYGSNPGTEVVDDAEDRVSAAETLVADPATNEMSVKDEVDISDPTAMPEHTVAEPRQQNDGYGSAPTGTGFEVGAELDVDPDGMTGASLSHVAPVLDEDAGTAVETLAPEPQAAAPEVRDESSPDATEAEEESVTVPMATEIAETNIPGQAIGEEAGEELNAVPTVADVIGTEQPDVADDVADGEKEESITAPDGTGTTGLGTAEANLGEHNEREPGDSTHVSDGMKLDDEADAKAAVPAEAVGVDTDDEFHVRGDGDANDEPAPLKQVSELESSQQQPAPSADQVQELTEKRVESVTPESEPSIPIISEEFVKDLEPAGVDVDDEVDLRADDDADDECAPRNHISIPESGKELLAQCVDRSQGLTKRPAEIGTTESEPSITMEELIKHFEPADVDLGSELEVRVDDDTSVTPVSEDEVLAVESGERNFTGYVDQSQGLSEKAAESEAKGFESPIVMEELAKHLEPANSDASHEFKVRVDDDTGVPSASEDQVLLESDERQLGECVDISQGPMETAAETKLKEPEHLETAQELAHEPDVQTTSLGQEEELEHLEPMHDLADEPDVQTTSLGQKEELEHLEPTQELANEPDLQATNLRQEEGHKPDGEAGTGTKAVEAVAGDHRGAEGDIFAPVAEIDQDEEHLGEPGRIGLKQSVPAEQDAAPEIPVSDLTSPVSQASTVQADVDEPELPACIEPLLTELPAADIPPSEPSPALSLNSVKEKPQLAPMPDLSKLIPAPTRASFSSDATSFTSTTRNSVDTFRPSKDEQSHPPIPTPAPDYASTSHRRPATAGYLGIGLRGPRLIEVGLRGALGDVKAHRLSLPLQHMVAQETMDGQSLAAAERPSAPTSEAGGKGPRLGRRRGGAASKPTGTDGDGDGDGDGEVAVLPRMMMLLAGAMVIGKIMGRSMPE